jgi:hypothetical protein
MGYTHYMTTGKKVNQVNFTSIKAEIKIIEAHMKSIGVPLFDGRGEEEGVVYEKDYVAFNGDESKGEGHETFYMDRNDDDFNFCKTANKPYDLAVCLALLCIKKRVPTARISSDGDMSDWSEAVETYGKIFKAISIEFDENGINIK